MVFLALSFFAGVLSVFAACVLPLLPVIVGGSLTTGGSRKRMYVIVGSLAVSIVLFTLLLKASTTLIGIPEEVWRYISGGIIFLLGIFILFPNLWVSIPGVNALNRGSNRLLASGYQRGGLVGDAVMGLALGPVFASCSPTYFIILATVLPAQPILGLVYLIAYAIGLSLTLLIVAIVGERIVQKMGIALNPDGWFFRSVGLLLLVVGILIFSGTMRNIETWLVDRGFDATFIELRLLGAKNETANVPADPNAAFMSPEMKVLVYKTAPELVSPVGYINTNGEPITIGEFKGKKVVLIDFWTYSCINCQRTFPYLRAWYDTYSDQGLEIIGVHTPEFAFEKVPANVQAAVEKFDLIHPTILDNDYKTWAAFGNQYWPRKYLIDIDGFIVYDHIGEGGYEETEMAIQRALAERAERLGMQSSIARGATVPVDTVDVDFAQVGSPETYFGSLRNEYLGNGHAGTSGPQTFTVPGTILRSKLYLGGSWNIEGEYARSQGAATITYKYKAKNVYLVAAALKAVKMTILIDGQPVGNFAGADVHDGVVTVQENTLYTLVEGDAYEEHTLEIRIEGAGLEAYAFTFG